MFEDLKLAIVDGDTDLAAELTKTSLGQGSEATQLVSTALVPAMDEVATLWQEGEFFMSDVILAANAFGKAMALIAPALAESGAASLGKIVIGVVEGDLHDLGKDIVVAMLRANGFEVIDLGIDVALQTFVDTVSEQKPDILGIGAYMSSTQGQMRDVIAAIDAAGLRADLKIIVGGVCVNADIALAAGADAYGADAMATVGLAKEYLEV